MPVKSFLRAERMAAAVPLVVALALSAVVSQVSKQVGATAFPTEDQAALVAQSMLGDTQSLAVLRPSAMNAPSQASIIPASLTIKDFDMVRARAVIAASALSGTEKALFARALDAAVERPELLVQVLTGLQSALERQG